jgi:hypothetical protein
MVRGCQVSYLSITGIKNSEWKTTHSARGSLMSPTATEKRIIQSRRSKKTGAILVPILEQLLEDECIPEDEEDFRFMDMLVRARSIPRAKGVFSPSMLGSCVRQAWFAKRGEEKHMARSPQTNGYFLKGNFIHFQWQFACWKAHRAGAIELVTIKAETPELDFYGNGTRPGVEVRVGSGDFMGTIDALAKIMRPIYVIDFKGINVIDFQRAVKNGAKQEYRKQIVGYGMIYNLAARRSLQSESCLLVSENKAGPTNSASSSPLALHETLVPIAEHEAEVRRRLKTLRFYDHKDEMPPPECVSTTHMGFQECPFNRYCHDEVKERQRERERKAAKLRKPLSVARSRR